MPETVYLSIFKDADKTVVIEYAPLADGAIEIVSVDIRQRSYSHFQIRQRERRKPRQMRLLTLEEEQAEAMQPYTRREA